MIGPGGEIDHVFGCGVFCKPDYRAHAELRKHERQAAHKKITSVSTYED